MNNIKLFILEDSDQDFQSFEDSRNILQKQNKVNASLHRFANCEDSLKNLDNTFDGAILDLKIGSTSGAGNEIAKKILADYKIPTIIHTATPSDSDVNIDQIPVMKKGVITCDEIIMHFDSIYSTGITKIFGDRGHVNILMKDLFWNTLVPNIKTWQGHSCSVDEKEKSLLKVTINHLQELIENDSDFVLGEEMYIRGTARIKTGTIVKFNGIYYVVVTPACDLELRDDGKGKKEPKTSRVLLCEVDESNSFFKNAIGPKTGADPIKDLLKKFVTNQVPYHHWLPKIEGFQGGVMNYRHIISVPWDDFNGKHEIILQISQSFTKDIISRLSSYYSRQGQPDFSLNYHVEKLFQDHGASVVAAAAVAAAAPKKVMAKEEGKK
nr:response regulator [Bacteriovorax sp. HI3]